MTTTEIEPEARLLTRKQAAEYLGVSAQTLAQHRHDGPRYVKLFGTAIRYDVNDLDSFIKQNRR